MNGGTDRPRPPRFGGEQLKKLINAIFEHSDQTYGYRAYHAQLARQSELVARVGPGADARARPGRLPAQAMAADHHRARRSRPDPRSGERDFTATAPGEKMVGDITYIQTWQGWLYLATVIDCHTKAVHRMRHGRPSPHRLVIACARRWPPGTIRSPTAQYSILTVARQYTSADFAAATARSRTFGDPSAPPECASTTP